MRHTQPHNKHAIVMLSIGDRPWCYFAAKSFNAYAQLVNADFFLELDMPSEELLPLGRFPKRGRANKKAYACKTYYAWIYLLRGYERVLFVDDTCIIKPDTPNVFEIVPKGSLGGVGTGMAHAQYTFDYISRFISKHGIDAIPFDRNKYLNSGFIVYDQSMIDALSPERIINAKRLLMARLPHQTLLYYLINSRGIHTHVLPRSFNTVPAARLPKDERRYISDIIPYLPDDAYVLHLTGIYRNRGQLVEQMYRYFF